MSFPSARGGEEAYTWVWTSIRIGRVEVASAMMRWRYGGGSVAGARAANDPSRASAEPQRDPDFPVVHYFERADQGDDVPAEQESSLTLSVILSTQRTGRRWKSKTNSIPSSRALSALYTPRTLIVVQSGNSPSSSSHLSLPISSPPVFSAPAKLPPTQLINAGANAGARPESPCSGTSGNEEVVEGSLVIARWGARGMRGAKWGVERRRERRECRARRWGARVGFEGGGMGGVEGG